MNETELTEWPVFTEDDELEFTCPRCNEATSEQFYGPCDICVLELREKQQRVAEEVEAADYEPKMNVTPNAIATKD